MKKRCRMGYQYLRCLRADGHNGPHRIKGPMGSRFEFPARRPKGKGVGA